jgi:hypothetical protein
MSEVVAEYAKNKDIHELCRNNLFNIPFIMPELSKLLFITDYFGEVRIITTFVLDYRK